MEKVIITGGTGFVGRAVIKELINQNVEVTALVRPGSEKALEAHDLLSIVDFELSKAHELDIPHKKFDVFYHIGWEGSSGPARCDESLQLDNVKWTLSCVRLAKKLNCKKFVAAGSLMEKEILSAFYAPGYKPQLPYIYGVGKMAAHLMASALSAELGIDFIWAVITNAYGPGENSPRLINTTIRKIFNNEQLNFTSGEQFYDFVYIDDLAKAFYLIGKSGKAFHEYLIGSSKAKPLKEFLLDIKDALNAQNEFIFGGQPFEGIKIPLEAYDCSQIKTDTGFEAQTEFKDGIILTKDWILSQ